jgi:hypothetical protein
MNCIIKIASKAGRNYITPEDINEARQTNDRITVCLDVLEVFGKRTTFGWEDFSLCAFVAWEGKK